MTDTEETFYDVSVDVSATVTETFCDVSADVSADVSSGPCSHLPDEIIMEIFSYLPPNQVWYSTSMLFSTNAVFWIRIFFYTYANQLVGLSDLTLYPIFERGSHVPEMF